MGREAAPVFKVKRGAAAQPIGDKSPHHRTLIADKSLLAGKSHHHKGSLTTGGEHTGAMPPPEHIFFKVCSNKLTNLSIPTLYP
jgi:hypothetical protein